MFEKLWNRIISMAAPGVTAQYPPDGEPAAFKDPVLPECFQSVLGTGGRITATGAQQGTQAPLVNFDE